MLNYGMSNKSFEVETSLNETPNIRDATDKLLKPGENQKKRVDINVLKARAQEIEDGENRKNVFIFIFFLVALGVIGIYLSI